MEDADHSRQHSPDDTARSALTRHGGQQPGPGARALGAQARVVEENGRWIVYLSVDFWEPNRTGKGCDDQATDIDCGSADASDLDDENWPIQSYWKRIADYPDRQRADVAAQWFERSADRNLRRPPLGF